MSSSLIAIIISAVLAVAMIISFFIGMGRGVKRSLLNLGISAIMILTAFLITPVITNALMGITIDYKGNSTTLGTLASVVVSTETSYGTYLEYSQTLKAFVNGIVPAVTGIVVFVILCFVLKIIGQIVYAILVKCCFKSRIEEENEGLKRSKLGGGLLSVAKTFLFFVCIFLPLTSLTTLLENNFFPNYAEASASSITDTLDSLPTTEELSNKLPKEVKRIVAGYNKSPLGYCGQLFGIHNISFDYISQMQINGEKLSLRQSADQLLETYNYVLEVYENYKADSEDFFKNFNYTKVDSMKERILESGAFKGFVLNVIYDLSQSYEEVLDGSNLLNDFGDVLADIKQGLHDSQTPIEDLKNDFYKLADIFKSAGKSGFLDTVIKAVDSGDTESLIYDVADKYMDNFIVDCVDGVFNIKTVRYSFGSLFDIVMEKVGDGDIENILKTANPNITNWEQFIYDLKDITTDVADLYDHVTGALSNASLTVEDFMDDPYLFLKADPTKTKLAINDLGAILDKTNNLEIMKDASNQKLIPQILDVLGFENILEGIEAPAGTRVNYSYMFKKLSSAISYLLEFDLYDEIVDENYTDAICKIADAISTDAQKVEKLKSIFNSIYEVPKVKEITIDAFKDSLSSFVDISVLDDKNVRNEELGYMTDILIALAKNKVTVGTQQISFLKYLLTDENNFEGLISSIDENAVDEILSPILASKMTNKICKTIFNSIEGTMTSITGENIEIWDNANEQNMKAKLIDENEEIRNIFKKFLAIYGVANFNAVEYEDLGAILDAMKVNAYRVELLDKTNEGIFKSTFDAIIAKAEREFGTDSEHPMSFVNAMNVDYIYEVEFAKLMTIVEKMQDYSTLQFVDDIKDMLNSGSDVSSEDVETMLGHISENETQVDEILEAIANNNITIDVGEINIGGETDIESAIDNYAGISDTTKELLKAILKQNA